MANPTGLNDSQKRHLRANCQYADKLLSEVQEILHAANSKSIFPKYAGALTPVQVRVVEDYIARIRAQIVRALESQDVPIPAASFQTVHSVQVTLTFAGIALEECTADRMRGYGEVPPEVIPELNGLVSEIKALLDQLNGYLGQNLDKDPGERLRRLQQTGNEALLLGKLERIISQYGLVDYRDRLSAILDRLESDSYEIALFGRVSSGKSSLLNHIIGFDLLPVGVNPITAVPTRIAFGAAPRLIVRTAGQRPETLAVDRISEFVTEQQNPANRKRVERLLVEFPSARLKDGIVLVDTPGLGSLASAGAAETLAYLPRCDLGVVLIDAGSTLTTEDLSTLESLNRAAIETTVLLSKADLLAREDAVRSADYIAQQIRTHLGLSLPVHAVSIKPDFTDLLDRWFREELAPLYQSHRQLTRQSLRKKIAALRDSVAGTLKGRVSRTSEVRSVAQSQRAVAEAEALLRRMSGRFEEARELWFRYTLEIREYAPSFLGHAASHIVERWRAREPAPPLTWETLSDMATTLTAEKAKPIRDLFENLARDLAEAIRAVSGLLNQQTDAEQELKSVINEMPRLDLGSGDLLLKPPWSIKISGALARRNIEGRLKTAVGERLRESFGTFASMLEAWSWQVSKGLQLRFNSYADSHRSELARLSGGPATHGDPLGIQEALAELNDPFNEVAPSAPSPR